MQNSISRNNYDKKVRKLELENNREISCGRCPYNKGENANHHRPKQDKYKNKKRNSIRKFSENFIKSQVELEPEFKKILNDNFWDLLIEK